MKERSWEFIGFSLMFFLPVSAYGLRLFERFIDPRLGNMSSAIWLSLITMTTVGYGDFYPSTQFGRLVSILTSLYGVILTSLFVISLTNMLTFASNERKAYMLLQRLKYKEQL